MASVPMKGFICWGGFVINDAFDVSAVVVCPKLCVGAAAAVAAFTNPTLRPPVPDVVDGFVVPQPDVMFPLTTNE